MMRRKILNMNRKNIILFLGVALTCAGCAGDAPGGGIFKAKDPIKVGILHSLTGNMAISEKTVVDATLLAIEELNQEGGLLGRKIEPVVVDGQSDPRVFAQEAERLIAEENVSVVFGCWTSACRKTVKPVFEKYNHLLFYPVQYEGLETSPNIIYTGAAPNQQIIPAVKWAFDHLGKRFFLVASDYVFPRAANAIIKDQLQILGAQVAGEEYILLQSNDVKNVIQKIAAARPEIILNTINGETNIAFFRELKRAGITPEQIPVISFSISENEIPSVGVENMEGSYASGNYFQSIDSEENRKFVKAFKARYGSDRPTNDPMEAAYFGVHLWAKAVNETDTDQVREVQRVVGRQSLKAPEGMIYIDPEILHTWKTVRIGKVNSHGQFDIVWSSEEPIRPRAYLGYRSKDYWDMFLKSLYSMWGNNWENSEASKRLKEETVIRNKKHIETLAKHPVLIVSAEASGRENTALSRDEIMALDRDWNSARETDGLIRPFLSNECARVLIQFQKDNPQFIEIFVTDTNGLTVAAANKTSNYYQADEDWWQETYNAGKGKVFLGDLEYGTSVHAWGMSIAAPIYNQQGNMAGIIKSVLTFDQVSKEK